MRALIACTLLCVVFPMAVAAPVPKNNKKTVEEQLLGSWKLTESAVGLSDYVFTVTYQKGGEMTFAYESTDEDTPTMTRTGTYKTAEASEKYPLGSIDWTINEDDSSRGEISKILKLTETELKFEDPEGLRETFVRVKEMKKK